MSIILEVIFCSLGDGVAKWLQAGEKNSNTALQKQQNFWLFLKGKIRSFGALKKSQKFYLQCTY